MFVSLPGSIAGCPLTDKALYQSLASKSQKEIARSRGRESKHAHVHTNNGEQRNNVRYTHPSGLFPCAVQVSWIQVERETAPCAERFAAAPRGHLNKCSEIVKFDVTCTSLKQSWSTSKGRFACA